MSDETSVLEDRIADLEGDLESRDEEIKDLKSQVHDLEDKLATARSYLSGLKGDVENALHETK